MKTNLLKLSLALSISAVVGCASAPSHQMAQQGDQVDIDIAKWEASEQEYGEGVVLISTYISKACNTYATDFVLKKLSMSSKTFEIEDALFLNQKRTDSQFDGYYGHVYQLDLEAGVYQLSLDSTSPLFDYNDKTLSSEFELKPDEVKYLGEVKIEDCSSAGFTVENNWENVEKTFKSVFPELEVTDVSVEMLEVRVPVASL